jgi:hypothetical protein
MPTFVIACTPGFFGSTGSRKSIELILTSCSDHLFVKSRIVRMPTGAIILIAIMRPGIFNGNLLFHSVLIKEDSDFIGAPHYFLNRTV